MTSWQKLVDSQKTSPALRNLDGSQVEAIINVLVLTIHADERVSFMEKIHFEDQLMELPWIEDKQTRLAEYIKRATDKAAKAQSDADVQTIIHAAATAVRDAQAREKIYQMAVVLAATDMEIHDTEKHLLGLLATAFGLNPAFAEKVLKDTLAGI